MSHILIVEDEAAITTLLEYNLKKAGFTTSHAGDGEAGLRLAKDEQPDLILLDWMLPLLSGMEVCRQIRKYEATSATPIIMLTARAEETDKISGLTTGADDYMTKPFSPAELIARIQALLRRSAQGGSAKQELVQGSLRLDQIQHKAWRGSRALEIGPTEYRLLRFFMKAPNQVFSREALLEGVWGDNIHVEARTVDVHIRRLRKILNANGEPDVIRTVRAAGYALEIDL